MPNANLEYLFKPRSVAVIGASRDKSKIGHKLLLNIIGSGYSGKIYPINPNAEKILDYPAYESVLEIKGEVDLACIVIPAKFTFEAVKECSQKKVKFCSIITSGFSEVGNDKEEKKIVKYAHEHGMRILGPNVFGLYSSLAPINATFGPNNIKPGNVAIITQSGALGIALMGKTQTEGISLSAIISVGNKADITEDELLLYLASDKNTKVIFMYIEGLKNGRKFIKALEAATQKKPVIILKSGKSVRGAMAAASHTGSLAGENKVFSDIMKQYGTIRAATLQEAITRIKFFSNSSFPKGENALIITNGGGVGVLATDACERHRVKLFTDIKTLKKIGQGAVPEFGSFKNPIDLTGQASTSDYKKVLKAAIENPNVHSIICLGCETAVLNVKKLAFLTEETFITSRLVKPIVFSFLGGNGIKNCINRLSKKQIPIFGDVDEAVSCLGASYFNYRYKHKSKGEIHKLTIDKEGVKKIITRVRDNKRGFFLASEAAEVMKQAGIPVPRSLEAKTKKQAVKFSEMIGYPVVMKIISEDIIHKTDAGGVMLNIGNNKEAASAFEKIMRNCKNFNAQANIYGVEVCEMTENGLETIVGARNDKIFGPIVVFGLGGLYVEVLKDVRFRAFPISREEAELMIRDIDTFPILAGIRGEKEKDIAQIVDTILKLGEILVSFKEIRDIEINPLVVYERGKGVKALDTRILL